MYRLVFEEGGFILEYRRAFLAFVAEQVTFQVFVQQPPATETPSTFRAFELRLNDVPFRSPYHLTGSRELGRLLLALHVVAFLDLVRVASARFVQRAVMQSQEVLVLEGFAAILAETGRHHVLTQMPRQVSVQLEHLRTVLALERKELGVLSDLVTFQAVLAFRHEVAVGALEYLAAALV